MGETKNSMMVNTKVATSIKGVYSASMVVYNMAFWMLITLAFRCTIRALVGKRSNSLSAAR